MFNFCQQTAIPGNYQYGDQQASRKISTAVQRELEYELRQRYRDCQSSSPQHVAVRVLSLQNIPTDSKYM